MVICPNEAFTITAISSNNQYRWQDGSTEPTLTIFEEGLYWCCTFDDCGGEICDSMLVEYDETLQVDLGPDLLLCSKDFANIEVKAPSNSKIRWYPKDEVGCDTCRLNSVIPDVKTTYIVVSETPNGCVSVDSLTIDVSSAYEFFDTIQFCTGEAVIIDNQPVMQTGDFIKSFTTVAGCDSIYNYFLIERPDTTFNNEVFPICEGDTLWVDGSPIFEHTVFTEIDTSGQCVEVFDKVYSIVEKDRVLDTLYTCKGVDIQVFGFETDQTGVFTETYSRIDLCDSIQTFQVIAQDTFYDFTLLEICANEKVEIFGDSLNTGGIYKKTFTTLEGCDSVEVVELIVKDSILDVQQLTICATDSVMIFGNYEREPGEYSQVFPSLNGCDSTTTVLLETTAPFQLEATSTPTCFSDSSGTIALSPMEGNPPFIFNWESGLNDSTIQNLSQGTYYFTITDQSGCLKSDSILIQNETFEFHSDPIDATCFEFTNGSIEILTTNPGLEFSIDGIDFTNNPVFNQLSAGNYEITIRNTSGCSTAIPVEVGQPSPLLVSLPNDTLINLGDSISLDPVSNKLATDYLWYPPDFLDCEACPDVIAKPLRQSVVRVQIIDENGCIATDSMTIMVRADRSYYVPSAFSPNGDGINDFFTIYGDNTLASINELKIFDRWGELIWAGENLTPNVNEEGWNGSFRDQPMNSNVFVFVGEIEFIDGVIYEVAGDITLLR